MVSSLMTFHFLHPISWHSPVQPHQIKVIFVHLVQIINLRLWNLKSERSSDIPYHRVLGRRYIEDQSCHSFLFMVLPLCFVLTWRNSYLFFLVFIFNFIWMVLVIGIEVFFNVWVVHSRNNALTIINELSKSVSKDEACNLILTLSLGLFW